MIDAKELLNRFITLTHEIREEIKREEATQKPIGVPPIPPGHERFDYLSKMPYFIALPPSPIIGTGIHILKGGSLEECCAVAFMAWHQRAEALKHHSVIGSFPYDDAIKNRDAWLTYYKARREEQ